MKKSIKMRPEYEEAIARQFEAKAKAVENVTITFNHMNENTSPANKVALAGYYAKAIEEVKKIFEK